MGSQTRMMGLPHRETSLTSLAVCIQYTSVADRQTDTGRQLVPRLCIPSRGKNQTRSTRVLYADPIIWSIFRDAHFDPGHSNKPSFVLTCLNRHFDGTFERSFTIPPFKVTEGHRRDNSVRIISDLL